MEYHELPALSLTFWQAQRLWNLSEELCERALQSLVREKFLIDDVVRAVHPAS